MRSFVITLIVLVAVIVGTLATAPLLVDWNDYRGLLTRQAEAITGGRVTIEGRISFSLLPSPTLTLARIKMTGGTPAGGHGQLVVDRLDLRLRVLRLLRGQVQVADIRLVRPVLQLERPPEDAPPSNGRNPLMSLIAIRPDRLAVVDGRAVLRGEQGAWQLGAIDLDLATEGPDGPFALRGSFAALNREFDIDARIGRLSPDNVGTLRLALSARGELPTSLTYNGAVWWDADNPRLRGDVTLAGDDVRLAALMVSDVLGSAAPQLPPWLDRRFEISGALQLDRTRLLVDKLRLLLDDQQADGQLSLAFGAKPSLTLGLRAQRLELADPLAAGLTDLAPLTALSRALHGQIDLSVAALHYRDRSADRVRLRLALTGDGEVAVEQASAILPGQTDLRFEGRQAAAGDATGLRGDLNVVTDDLGALLDWLDLEPAGVEPGRLRTLSLSGALAIDHDAVRLPHLELRVDATKASGSAGLAMGVAGSRPRLTADLVLDRLNLDAYLADLRPSAAAGLLQPLLRDVDAAITGRVERLTWRDLQLRDVNIALGADQGRLQVSNASFEVADEATARLDGEVDLESGVFSWSTEVRTPRLTRLLRRLGLPAPLMLTRAPPLTLTARAAGEAEQFDLQIEAGDGAGKLSAVGKAGWVDGGPSYDLEVELDHPDFSALVRPLGARTAVSGDAVPAALSFTGKVTGAASGYTIAGAARLGGMSLTGLLARQPEQPRPRYDLQLSVAEPTLDMLKALLELTGLGPPAALLDAPLLGNWPQQALDLGLALPVRRVVEAHRQRRPCRRRQRARRPATGRQAARRPGLGPAARGRAQHRVHPGRRQAAAVCERVARPARRRCVVAGRQARPRPGDRGRHRPAQRGDRGRLEPL